VDAEPATEDQPLSKNQQKKLRKMQRCHGCCLQPSLIGLHPTDHVRRDAPRIASYVPHVQAAGGEGAAQS
jgi:hypothetical protein